MEVLGSGSCFVPAAIVTITNNHHGRVGWDPSYHGCDTHHYHSPSFTKAVVMDYVQSTQNPSRVNNLLGGEVIIISHFEKIAFF